MVYVFQKLPHSSHRKKKKITKDPSCKMSSHVKGHLTQLLTRLKMYLWMLWHFSSFKEMVFLKCLWPPLPFDLISLALWCFKVSAQVCHARPFGMGCNWIFSLLSVSPLHSLSLSLSCSHPLSFSGMESTCSTSLFTVMTWFSNTTAEPAIRLWKSICVGLMQTQTLYSKTVS